MVKASLSAKDFLSAIAGEPEVLPVPGVGTVVVRPLNVAEVQAIVRKAGEDETALMVHALVTGMVDPQLSEDDIPALQRAAAGPFLVVAKRIMELSGMTNQDTLENLAGGGSPATLEATES